MASPKRAEAGKYQIVAYQWPARVFQKEFKPTEAVIDKKKVSESEINES